MSTVQTKKIDDIAWVKLLTAGRCCLLDSTSNLTRYRLPIGDNDDIYLGK